jgi:hypothetical protein
MKSWKKWRPQEPKEFVLLWKGVRDVRLTDNMDSITWDFGSWLKNERVWSQYSARCGMLMMKPLITWQWIVHAPGKSVSVPEQPVGVTSSDSITS